MNTAGRFERQAHSTPDGWAWTSLAQVGSILTGPFGTLLQASEYARDRGVPVISVAEIRDGFFNVSARTPLVDEEVVRRLPQFTLRAGDIVFGRKRAVDRSALIRSAEEGWFLGSDAIRVRPAGGIDPGFLAHQVRTQRVKSWLRRHCTGSTTMATLNRVILGKVAVAVPRDIEEQEAIAEALSDADALIESLEQLIAKKRLIKQGVMQELLTGKRRLPGFEEEWESKLLGDLATMASGGTPLSSNTTFYGGGILWASISDITRSGRILSTTERTLTEIGLTNSSAQMFPAGTVMYAMYASLGECAIASMQLSCSQAILGIRAKTTELAQDFLYYYLCSIKERIKRSGQQGTQSNLNKSMVQALELRLPQRDEQEAIASVLRDMDQELEALALKLEKARQIKQGMMHNLLTGKIRLT